MAYEAAPTGVREKLTHKFLFYIARRTSDKHPEWRNVTIEFFYSLFEIIEINHSINVFIQKTDGLYIYHGGNAVTYLHFRQKHFLVHCQEDYLLSKYGNKLFNNPHKGSWPLMWKISESNEVESLLQYLNDLKVLKLSNSNDKSRTIPVWVQELVFERDQGKCVACQSKVKLCFDHIVPFAKGGASDHPNNIQLLCSECNLAKSANFWPVKVLS